jgi:hypothetical protein
LRFDDPYAPPSSLAADSTAPISSATRELAMRRGWRAFGLSLLFFSFVSGAMSGLVAPFVPTRLGETTGVELMARIAISSGPGVAITGACFAAATFVHHFRTADVKALGPMFSVVPGAAIVAAAISWFSGAIASFATSQSANPRLLAGSLHAIRLFDLGLALASSCAYAATLGPLATLALPAVTKRMPTQWLRFFVVWLVVVFSAKLIDAAMHLLV